MFTVAIIGPDGAGKSTITRQVINQIDLPAKYIYMGVNLESSNLVLPTTYLALQLKRLRGGRPDMAGPPDPTRPQASSKNPLKRGFKLLKLSLRLTNLIAEEWFRQLVVWYYLWRGNIVLFDRHFFIDYYAHDVTGQNLPLPNRVHGFNLKHLYPKPDMVIMLDAPADVLFERKGEGTLEFLEARRQEYFKIQEVIPNFYIVDATQSQDVVAREVESFIYQFHAERRYEKRKESLL